MIGLARGMVGSYNIPEWGLWIDTWKGLIEPPAFTPTDVEKAIYMRDGSTERSISFFEQGCFFGTCLGVAGPTNTSCLGQDGYLTEYWKGAQRNSTLSCETKKVTESSHPKLKILLLLS